MAKAVSVLRAPDRLARACMAVGCLLVAFAAVCTAQAPTLTTPGAVTIRAASQPCVPPAAPLQPGRFAGATENGLFLASPNPTNQFDPRAGRTPDTLNTGNLFRNSGLNSPNDIAISDTLVEFGSETSFPITGGGTGYQRVCLDTTTDGLVTLSTSQSQDTVFPASTFRLSSSRFAGCTLRFNGGSYPTMPSGVIDSQGNLDITLPQALVATGQANWNIVSCPGGPTPPPPPPPPPPSTPCAGQADGTKCSFGSGAMVDASSLKHSVVDEATALSLIGDAADPSGRHRHHHKHACSGVCQNGVCVAAHHTKHCCHHAEDDADVEHKRKWHCWG